MPSPSAISSWVRGGLSWTFVELAMAGRPPHRGGFMKPGTAAAAGASFRSEPLMALETTGASFCPARDHRGGFAFAPLGFSACRAGLQFGLPRGVRCPARTMDGNTDADSSIDERACAGQQATDRVLVCVQCEPPYFRTKSPRPSDIEHTDRSQNPPAHEQVERNKQSPSARTIPDSGGALL